MAVVGKTFYKHSHKWILLQIGDARLYSLTLKDWALDVCAKLTNLLQEFWGCQECFWEKIGTPSQNMTQTSLDYETFTFFSHHFRKILRPCLFMHHLTSPADNKSTKSWLISFIFLKLSPRVLSFYWQSLNALRPHRAKPSTKLEKNWLINPVRK